MKKIYRSFLDSNPIQVDAQIQEKLKPYEPYVLVSRQNVWQEITTPPYPDEMMLISLSSSATLLPSSLTFLKKILKLPYPQFQHVIRQEPNRFLQQAGKFIHTYKDPEDYPWLNLLVNQITQIEDDPSLFSLAISLWLLVEPYHDLHKRVQEWIVSLSKQPLA